MSSIPLPTGRVYHTIMLSCVIVAQPGLGATMQKTWLRIGGALLASLLALLLIAFVQPWTDSLTDLLAMSLPVLALAAWIAAGSERIAYAGIQIGFTFALAFLSWFAPLTNLTELRDRVLGILLGVLVSSIVHLYLWPDSEAPQLKTRLAALYRRLADCLAAPKEAVPLAPLLVAFTDSEALIHRVSPPNRWARMLTPGPRRKIGRCAPPSPRPRRSPASAKATDSTPRRETRPWPLRRTAAALR
ncbi:tripartite multidrug resistance system membrane fusion protein [Klebsiella pneumoniae]|uniref:Tripartite multidrug resistance system membrane fusion protein n=1 Tax=Klebsiella pneumoniae TaxID=573 RepID=A0A2X1QJQ3_KLEPN|nr:tripartite multidrug resistance system membrane fusion protein [Klebsiella pneumoniae]